MWLNRIKLKKKFLLIFLVVGVIPVLILGVIYLYGISKNLETYEKQLLHEECIRNKNAVFNLTYLSGNIAAQIISSEDVINTVTRSYNTSEEEAQAVRKLTVLSSYSLNYVEYTAVKLYIDRPGFSTQNLFVSVDDEIRNSAWYQKAVSVCQ